MDLKKLAAKALEASQGRRNSPPGKELVVTVGARFLSDMEAAIQGNTPGKKLRINFDFPDDLMREVDDAIGLHRASSNVLYADEMQFLDVVGESFHQEQLQEIAKEDRVAREGFGLSDEDAADWYSGFLIPEPWNQHDSNAVMVLMIVPKEEYEVVQVGHLAREQAKRVQSKIIKYLNQGALIPILLKLTGGTKEKPTVGVLARAKTDKINF